MEEIYQEIKSSDAYPIKGKIDYRIITYRPPDANCKKKRVRILTTRKENISQGSLKK